MDLNAIIKRLIMETVFRLVMGRLVAALPFLGWPIIGPIVGFFVGKLLTIVLEETQTIFKFTVINAQVEEEQRKYDEAVAELSAAVNVETPDAQAVEAAKQKFKDSLRDLVRLKPQLRQS